MTDKNEIPETWSITELGDISASIQYGFTTKAATQPIGPKFLRITDIQNNSVNWEHVPFCKVDSINKDKYLLEQGDLLFARTGATVGKSYLISGKIPESIFASYLIRVKIQSSIEPKYIAFFFKSTNYWKQISESSAGIGQPNVNGTKLSKIKVPVAPQNEQKRVVAEIEKQFSRLDEAVENLKRVKANLKRYKASVLKAAVEGKLTEEWREKHPDVEPATELQQKINLKRESWIEQVIKNNESEPKRIKNKLKKHTFVIPKNWNIPDCWVWSSFLTACQIVVDCHNKTAPYETEGIPLVRTTNIKNGCLLLDNVKYVSQKTYTYWSRRCPPESGDILFTREAPMGEAAIIPKDIKLCMGQRTMLLRVFNEYLDAKYLLFVIMSPPFQHRFGRGAVGSGVKHLRVGDVESLVLPIPPLDEQKQIVETVEEKLSVMNEVELEVDRNLKRADRLRESILKKAFSGKL